MVSRVLVCDAADAVEACLLRVEGAARALVLDDLPLGGCVGEEGLGVVKEPSVVVEETVGCLVQSRLERGSGVDVDVPRDVAGLLSLANTGSSLRL